MSRRGQDSARLPAAERLLAEPSRFDFFQAVRLLSLGEPGGDGPPDQAARRSPVGGDGDPRGEAVRFRALPSLCFPGSEIAGLHRPEGGSGREGFEMLVSFLGLTGPMGVLPQHYTRLILDRCREKDFALRDFLDLFNHRLISFFFRAWEKNRLPFGWERSRRGGDRADPATEAVFSLAGVGTGGLRDQMALGDSVFLHYAGLFADVRRQAVSLGRMVAELAGAPARVLQFQGRWISLSREDRTRLPSPESPGGLNAVLGRGAVVGDRTWDVGGRFRLRLGPLGFRAYCRLLPGGADLRGLCQVARAYAGPELDFDVAPVLSAGEVPPLRLEARADPGPRLGWTTWLVSRPVMRDFDGAVFRAEED